jgi:hypothetical protein
MRALVALTVALAALVLSAPAHALDVAVQDQGAAPADLQRVADGLGARTVRIIVAPGEPRARARAAGAAHGPAGAGRGAREAHDDRR